MGGRGAGSPSSGLSLSLSENPTQLSHYRRPGLCEWSGGCAEAAGSHTRPGSGARELEPLWGAPSGCWLCTHNGEAIQAQGGFTQNGADGQLPHLPGPLGLGVLLASPSFVPALLCR